MAVLPKRTIDCIDELNNPFDTIDKEYRRLLWEEREAKHQANLDTEEDPGFGCTLVSGDKGVGKTTAISLFAGDLYDRGFNVVSNVSLLFGNYFNSASELFTFLQSVPERTVIAIDEIHRLLSVFRQASGRQSEFVQELAGLRKNRICILAGTSQEYAVDAGYRGEVDKLIYPVRKRYKPAGKTNNPMARLPGWCHLDLFVLAPKPWAQGKLLAEQYGIPVRREKTKAMRMKHITPLHIYQAAAMQDSFAGLPTGAATGSHLDSNKMRLALDDAQLMTLGDGTETFEEEEPTAAMEAQLDEVEAITDVWRTLLMTKDTTKRYVGFDYLMGRMEWAGHHYDEDDIERVLRRFADYRGHGSVNVQRLSSRFE